MAAAGRSRPPPADPPSADPPGPAPALPGCFDFAAPREWRAIDFLSDLHLAEEMPRTFAAWQQHLLGTPADAVFVLGDLFELWVGDDARALPFARRCVEVLAEASHSRAIAIMVGNRDFLRRGDAA
jgi:UDP-2,3-diacylglucosamine hydrolase